MEYPESGRHSSPGATVLSATQREALNFVANLQKDQAIVDQIASVESYDGPATMARITIAPEKPLSALPDGPAPVIPAVVDDAGQLAGEIILWITHGVVDCVEQTWYSESPPEALPDRDHIATYDQLGY